MPLSQNGWQSGPAAQIVPLTVAGVSFPGGVKAGDVHTVLEYVAAQWHARVEPLVAGWCWGYYDRPVRGQTTTVSNHGSGTALDFNAPRHPRGKRGTFTAAQEAAIRAICAETGVCRWGGTFSTTVDEMHVEVNATPAQVAAAALRISTVTPGDDMPLNDADKGFIRDQVLNIVRQEGISGAATQGAQILAQTAALTAAVQALAVSKGADPQAIAQVVDKAVRDHLATLTITVGDPQ